MMLIQFGNLKGSWLSNQFTKLLMTKCLEALPMPLQKRIKASLSVFALVFMLTLSWFFFLVIPKSVSQVSKYSKTSTWGGYYSSTKSKSSFENVSMSLFFSFISLSRIKVYVLYMSCIWRCYLRWIVSRHGYRYSSEHGSWSCFWWRGSQPA